MKISRSFAGMQYNFSNAFRLVLLPIHSFYLLRETIWCFPKAPFNHLLSNKGHQVDQIEGRKENRYKHIKFIKSRQQLKKQKNTK